MFTSKIDKQIKKDQIKRENEKIKRVFEALGKLPVCIFLEKNIILNTVNGIQIIYYTQNSNAGLSIRVGGPYCNLNLESAERILRNWTVMSKDYMFLDWAPEMIPGAMQEDDSQIKKETGGDEHVKTPSFQ